MPPRSPRSHPPPPTPTEYVLDRNLVYIEALGRYVGEASQAYPVLPRVIRVNSACGMRQYRAEVAYCALDGVPIYAFTSRPLPLAPNGVPVRELHLIHPSHGKRSPVYPEGQRSPLPPPTPEREVLALLISRDTTPPTPPPEASVTRVSPFPGYVRWEFAYRLPNGNMHTSSYETEASAFVELAKHADYRKRTHRVVVPK